MKRLVLLAVVLGAVLVGGCGPPKLDNGTVYRKTQEPAHTTIAYIPIFCGNGCFVMIPFYFFDDADYILWLRNCEPQPAERDPSGVIIHKRGCRQGVAYVDAKTWAKTPEGQWFDVHGAKPPSEATVHDPDERKGRA